MPASKKSILKAIQLGSIVGLLVMLVLPGCATSSRTASGGDSATDTQQRLDDLERRMQRLEGRPPVQPPYRNRAEIETQIKTLEEDRSKLLVKYTDQHPAVRDIDRKLLILHEQLGMIAPEGDR